MATRFLGLDFQINVDSGGGQGILGEQRRPQVTTLADGRFEVVYQSDYNGVLGDTDPIVSVFNADGSVSSPQYFDIYSANSNQSASGIAARPNGGYGVVLTNDLHANGTPDPHGSNVTYQPVAASGVPGFPVAIGDFNQGAGHDLLTNPAIATMASGQQVVVFERIYSPTDTDIFLNVVSVDGVAAAHSADSPLVVANGTDRETAPAIAAIGEKALVAYEISAPSTNIVARMYDGTNDTIGDPFLIADHATALANPRVAALDDHRYVIVYDDFGDVFGRVYDTANGGSLSAEFEVDHPGQGDSQPSVAATADGGFIVAWQGLDGADLTDIMARRFNSDGHTMGQQVTVNRLRDADQGSPTVAVSGVNAFIDWSDDAPRPGDMHPASVRGQVMSLTTQPDFNNNGVSDILWRNDDGCLAAWDMSRSGAIGGSAELKFNDVAARPDASWSIAGISDFTGDARADVLWRNAGGALALWTINHNTITDSAGIKDSRAQLVQPDASWSIAGIGDFDFDGKSDILWRNSGAGAVSVWTMDGATISSSAAVTSNGSAVAVDASWNVAGIGDFNGDGTSDVLWRNTSGDVVEWQMNSAAVVSSGPLNASGVAARPDASWSIAGVGDFNADGNADLLWRNTGGSLVAWLMNGSSIASSSPVTSGGALVAPDASWHVVEIGDFNLDARTDILWRNDNGALAEWMMDGGRIVSTTAPGVGGAAAAPGASWHTQANATNFA